MKLTGKNNPMYGVHRYGKDNPFYGKHHTEETKEKLRGRSISARTRKLISENHADISGENNPLMKSEIREKHLLAMRSSAVRNRISGNQCGEKNHFHGKHHSKRSKKLMSEKHRNISDETRKKMRLAAINRMKVRDGQVRPNYNPSACKIIDEYGKLHGYSFQHAENGGEVMIEKLGYFPDGIDESRKTIIEVDESHHRTNEKIRIRDIRRQQEIEKLGYKVIRVKL